jgi:hypothetical protein
MLTSFSCKVCTIMCDNASNNDTMIVALDLDGFWGAECCIQCFLHILNLTVKVWCSYIPTFSWFSQGMKAILSQFSCKLEDEEVQPALVPTSRKKCPVAKHQHNRDTTLDLLGWLPLHRKGPKRSQTAK